ncbi:MAG: preprotein translocase subunit YajC [Betaproteobacteria bacterium]|nr:preprotein translocase subunit YajC [Betaproteobacteria bacterium]
MAKILFIVVLLLVAYLFFKSWRKDGGGGHRQPEESKLPEDMVRCEVCGVNLPRSEAFITQGRLFCSDEHRKVGVDKGSRP